MRSIARAIDQFPNWPEVDLNWLRSPKARDIEKLAEAIKAWKRKLDLAEAMLARAQTAVAKKASSESLI
jgi:hypothetical protein